MSNLLEQASLVMIPSGYKEDVVYSEIPINGAGDLSFTRASNGTRINSQGLVEVVPWNLLQQSETFDSAPWTANNATITANSTTAPNGTITADTFTLTAGVDAGVYQAVNGVSNNYTISVYAKYVSGDKYLFIFGPLNSQGAKIWFDIQNGTVSNQLSGFTGTIENAGDGWYKCSIYNTSQAVLDYIQFGISTTNSNRVLSNNSVSYFWGAQVNLGTAKPYFPTTDRLNVPRLTYQNGGGGCPSLLLEKQSTNLATYSEQFDNAGWVKYQGGTITANSVTSPDGTQNADTLNVASGQTYSGTYQSVSGSSDVYTISIFAKYNTKRWMFIFDASASGQGWFDLQNGVVGTIPIGHTATIENFGNGWYRCTFKKNTAVTPAFFQIGLVDADGNSTPSSNGSSYIWGAQFEASSYPTSYIPTTSSSATRVADACFKTGISSLIGQTQGSVFFDFTVDTISGQTNFPVLWYMKDGGSGERYVQLFPNGNLLYNEYDGVSIIAQITKSGLTVGRHKCAIAYAPNDMTFYVDGVQIGTDTSGTPSGFSTFGFQYYASVYNSQQKVNQTVIFPTRLTNAELASLTTL